MASIKAHPGGWRAQVFKRGVRDSRVFKTKAAAANWAAAREAEILAGEARESGKKTLLDALRRYAKEEAPQHKGERWERIRLAAMEKTIPCASKLLGDVRSPDIAAWRDARLAAVSPASVSREWSLLGQVFSIAIREWGWIKANPMVGVRRPREANERTRRVLPAELKAICRALGWESRAPVTHGQTTALAFLVSLRTGMRAGEILGLEPGDIDLGRRVCTLRDTKNGDDREVPLSRAAVRLLRLVAGRPVPFPLLDGTRVSRFAAACREAGVEGLTFHDARAEGLTRLSAKVDPMTLAKISGHRDPRVLLNRYYRPSMEEVAKGL